MELIYKYKSNVDTLHLINASNKKVIYCFSSMEILTSIASQYCCYSQEKNIDRSNLQHGEYRQYRRTISKLAETRTIIPTTKKK